MAQSVKMCKKITVGLDERILPGAVIFICVCQDFGSHFAFQPTP
jgi:hypothetical protein